MADIVMPRLSDSMEEGTVLQWLKKVGDEVAVGDELVEIETDKANMAYESDVAGTLTEIIAEEGATLPIGEVIGRIGDSGEGSERTTAGPDDDRGGALRADAQRPSSTPPHSPPPAEDASETAAAGPSARASAPTDSGSPSGDGKKSGERVKASPLAKRMAKDSGLDLTQLAGSGPGGRILKADVELAASGEGASPAGGADVGSPRTAAEPPPAGVPTAGSGPAGQPPGPETAKGQVRVEELSKLQSTVSRRMAESKATAPHFYLETEVDMTKAVEDRARLKGLAAEGDVIPSFNDLVVKACALALREHPRANGAYRDGRFELYSRVNVGIAVAAQDALVVPTIFDADRKSLWEIALDSRSLSRKVRDATVTPPELSGATFTVSNLGMFGVDAFSAVINPPQAAILAVGAIVERPVIRDEELGTAHLMRINLACDHRILYGAQGAEFLARVRELLEEPFALAA
jgi:pyruvate dehydrogenase E2 component (dihydrolipoamide acetyltransferase)